MSNKAVRGKDNVVFSIAGTPAGTEEAVVHWETISRSSSRGSIATRDAASAGYDDSIAGDQKITYTINVNFQLFDTVSNDAGVDNLVAADKSGAIVPYIYQRDSAGAGGSDVETGFAFVTQNNDDNGDPMKTSFNLEVTEKPTYTAQV